MITYKLKFKWTTSKGRFTYGWNICSLYIDGKKVGSVNGGNYDMKGSVFGTWVQSQFKDDLINLDKEYNALKFFDKETKKYAYSKISTDIYTLPSIDGACGFESVSRIVEDLGYKITFIDDDKNHQIYVLEFKNSVDLEYEKENKQNKYNFGLLGLKVPNQ